MFIVYPPLVNDMVSKLSYPLVLILKGITSYDHTWILSQHKCLFVAMNREVENFIVLSFIYHCIGSQFSYIVINIMSAE